VPVPLPETVRTLAIIASLCAAIACRESEGSYQGYADRTAAVGDSALVAASSYLTLDSAGAVRYDSAAARLVERLSTQFGGIMRPDTVAVFHRQMLEGLDSLVLAFRVLRQRETSCALERTIDCADARDFGHILGSMRNGARLYLDARRRMRETMRSLGARFPDPPAVSASALTARPTPRPTS
jgi:hypothetical protein